jgi:predicted acyltransferase
MDQPSEPKRLLSIDVYRGSIMVFLMLESVGLYDHLITITEGSFFHSFFIQFTHHPWNGLRFWDLIQPGFMFIAGTAMALSLHKQKLSGIGRRQSFFKALKRSGWLFFWGVLDYAVRPGGLSFELWDVLTQLSFTLLVAFLIFEWSIQWQIIFSIALLIVTELLYRLADIPGFNQPFVDQHNFGNYVDLLLMNKINPGGWVAINCLPTAAHTIWGAIAGKILITNKSLRNKVVLFFVSGLICLGVGFLMDFTVTPIIKRIATSSFVIVSGGWCLIGLALFYWWIDVKKHVNGWHFVTVVGMNSVFIYLFFEIVGARWFNGYGSAIVSGMLGLMHLPENLILLASSLTLFFLEWSMCQFLWRRKIFFKL